jgi:GT2 family glycosyltransferase
MATSIVIDDFNTNDFRLKVKSKVINILYRKSDVLVIMPTYNRGTKCINVINQIMKQQYTNFDLLVIDDGSTPEHYNRISMYIAQINDPRVILQRNSKNMMIAKTINRGFKYFLGNNYRYVTWISDDNEYYPHFLHELVNLGGHFNYASFDWQRMSGTVTNVNRQYKDVNDLLKRSSGCAAFMWSRYAIQKIGFYDENMCGADDYDYLLRTFINIDANVIRYSEKASMKYILHKECLTMTNGGEVSKEGRSIRTIYDHLLKNSKFYAEKINGVYDNEFSRINSKYDDTYLKILIVDNSAIKYENNVLVVSQAYENVVVNHMRYKNQLSNYNRSEKQICKIQIKKILPMPKVSIVMVYYNRKEQTLNTLDGFERQYAGKYDFEVIIVNDNSNNDNKLDGVIKKYSYPINLIVISAKEKGDRITPYLAYNKGFSQATGKIIIMQNPEYYHAGDIIGYTARNLKEQDYFIYNCFSANSLEITNKIIKAKNIYSLIKDKNFLARNKLLCDIDWFNHSTKNILTYDYCFSIYKIKLDLIGGYDKKFYNCNYLEMEAFFLAIKYNLKLNMLIVSSHNCFVVKQFCDAMNYICGSSEIYSNNKFTLDRIKKNHEKSNFNFPKLLFLYWDGSPLSYLNYLTIESFNKYNPGWKIIVYVPSKRHEFISWKTNEQKLQYSGKCYFYKLYNIHNVVVQNICLDEIGFKNNASEVIKSDYFRYYILKKHGGLWSDFDIIYTDSVEEKMNFNENTVIFKCTCFTDPQNKITGNKYVYYPIGLFLTKPQSKFFEYILNKCEYFYNSNEYQSIGAGMFGKLFKSDISVFEVDESIKICNKDYYLPWAWNELDQFLDKKNNCLPMNNIGIHWFNGAEKSKKYAINLDKRLDKFKEQCYMDKCISGYIDGSLNTNKITIIMAYYNRKDQILETLKNFEKLYVEKYNFEVIIVDDQSDESEHLDDIINNYNFKIKYIKTLNKTWINPVVPYNEAINNISSDTKYVIIQNPEILHCGDIMKYTELLTDDQYYTFPVFASPSFNHNKLLKTITHDCYESFVEKIDYTQFDFDFEFYKKKYTDMHFTNYDKAYEHYLSKGLKEGKICNEAGIFYRKNEIYDQKGWLNHHIYSKRNLHFLSLITKNTLDRIGGFCTKMKNGLWYDDNDFVDRISKICSLKTIDSTRNIGIHQYHLSGSADQHLHNSFDLLRKNNYNIYQNNKLNNIIYTSPKLVINKKTVSNSTGAYKIGLCFKIYINNNTNIMRYQIISDFIDSLNKVLDHYNNLTVVGVVDCVPNDQLYNTIDKIDKRIKILVLNENKGISFSTNIGIEYLLNNDSDYIFCADDDIIFKNPDIFNFYLCNLIANNIEHVGYYPLTERKKMNLQNPTIKYARKSLIKIHHGYSGCFYCFSKNCISKFGYVPILDKKYGYEHEIFTKKITELQYDIINSDQYVGLNIKSFNITSSQSDHNTTTNYELCAYKNDNFFINSIDKWSFYNKYKCTIYICVKDQKMVDSVLTHIKHLSNIKIRVNNNASSFSNIVNNCLKDCETEIMIFCSHRVKPTQDDLNRLLCKINQGYGYVGLYRFAFLGINKEIINKVGYLDEAFEKGGYEDDDFRIRLNYHNIGFYEDHSVEYNAGTSTFITKEIDRKNKAYFHEKYSIDEKEKKIEINFMNNDNENYVLSNFLTHQDSVYVKNVNSYYGALGPGIHDFSLVKSKSFYYL